MPDKTNWPVAADRIARGLYWQEAWKLVEGCTHVSAGCDNCWSAAETKIRANHPNPKISGPKQMLVNGGDRRFNGAIRLREDNLDKPLHRKKPTVYAIWNDLFHEGVPFAFVDKAMEVIQRTPRHFFLILTKRPIFMRDYFEQKGEIENCWLGVSVEDQKTADERIPLLLQTLAKHRFISVEPLLSHIDLLQWLKGDKSNDRIREGISCICCGRSFFNRPTGENLEASETYSGKPRQEKNSALLEGFESIQESGTVKIGRISDSDVFGQNKATQSLCPSCRLDVTKQTGYTRRNANQSQKRNSRRHESRELGIDDSIGKRATQSQCVGMEAKSFKGREKSLSKINRRASFENPRLSGEDVSITDRENIRNNTECGLGNTCEKKLGTSKIDWIICGRESGSGARPMHPEWARSARDQCKAAGVPFFFKSGLLEGVEHKEVLK